MKVTVRVDGLKELDEALGELPKATARNVLKRALIKAAEPIAEQARALAPVRTGKLRDSIIISTRTTNPGKQAFAIAMKSGASREEAVAAARLANRGHKSFFELYVGPGRQPHAHLQEFGTAHHAPQPYMRPAWDANKMRALETIKKQLADEIEKARQRLAKKAAREAAKLAAKGA